MRHLRSPARSRPPFSQIHSSTALQVTLRIVGLGSNRTSHGTYSSEQTILLMRLSILIIESAQINNT
ncbi:hypothetical protein BpHYR1_045213 [Brachionus plicatilis]|uniref:Uncharacterized protein n=1 Tax=Brachionus plicatilis TaxID=10195 RepID=A0A3M7QXZ1_BRAPC|nr:hypothetical protein BpHYR1_045213 [Brachionus plicatilis]